MTPKLSDAQRRILVELVVCERAMSLDQVKPSQRKALLAAGLINIEPNPSKKRAQQVVATEKGWAWVVDNLEIPFDKMVNIQDAWNSLTEKIQLYLRERDDNLSSVLAAGTGREPQGRPRNDAVLAQNGVVAVDHPVHRRNLSERLMKAYLDFTGGNYRRRVKIAYLRGQVSTSKHFFDETLRGLLAANRIALFPEDDLSLLDPADHDGSVDLSGVPQHIIYWEK